MDTPRKYPRSLNEAFPRTAEYACSVEVGRRPLLWYVSRWVRMMLRRFG